MGGHIQITDRPASSFHLLLVVLLAVSASFLPSALTGHTTSAAPAPVVVPTAESVVLASSLGRSIPTLDSKVATPTIRTKPHVTVHHVAAPKIVVHTAPPVRASVHTTAPPSAPTPTPQASSYGCGAAIAYLSAHAAPGFTFECPGYADGHQAMTCENIPGLCPGTKLIAIAVPCAAAYMNEASNSWVLTGKSDAPIDPYGYCHG